MQELVNLGTTIQAYSPAKTGNILESQVRLNCNIVKISRPELSQVKLRAQHIQARYSSNCKTIEHELVMKVLPGAARWSSAWLHVYAYNMSSEPSAGLFWTKIIALPSSPTMLVYSMTSVPSVKTLLPVLSHFKSILLKIPFSQRVSKRLWRNSSLQEVRSTPINFFGVGSRRLRFKSD